MKRRSFQRGFTLIELLVVITIIGILVGMLLPAIMGAMCSAKQGTAQNTVSQLESSLKLYESDFGIYPPDQSNGNSPPLVLYLQDLNKTSKGVPYHNFKSSRIKGSGTSKHFYSQFGLGDEAFEFHYAAPRTSRYTTIQNYDCNTPDCSDMNEYKPNLWTAGCAYEPGTSGNEGIADVNNFK